MGQTCGDDGYWQKRVKAYHKRREETEGDKVRTEGSGRKSYGVVDGYQIELEGRRTKKTSDARPGHLTDDQRVAVGEDRDAEADTEGDSPLRHKSGGWRLSGPVSV